MLIHTITRQQVQDFMNDWDNAYYTYAGCGIADKRLQISIGEKFFRVLHGQEIVYEGYGLHRAVEEYNKITTKPEETVKLDN